MQLILFASVLAIVLRMMVVDANKGLA